MRREFAVALALLSLLLLVAVRAPAFFGTSNLADIALSLAPLLIVSCGMSLVILAGQIDISVGAQFAICAVVAGLAAKSGVPIVLVALIAAAAGGGLGAMNGALAGRLGIPSIVVTLATMAIFRQSLLWFTSGQWVQDLPARFQWFGLGQFAGASVIIGVSMALFALFAWSLRNLALGRAIYATGSDAEAARLAGMPVRRVLFGVFAGMGLLTGFAAALNAVRFSDVPSNSGIGLELKAIAAVVVGGTSINGGRGTLTGTLLGVLLLSAIGPALTFLGVNAYWEKAAQGAVILAAVLFEARDA